MTGPAALDGPHWTFSLWVYGRKGVPESCLLLQDRWGVDVNVLLLAAYAAATGAPPNAARLAAVNTQIAPWREQVVKHLRELRRLLKAGPHPAPSRATDVLRDQVKCAELMAEQIEQAALADLLLPNGPGRPSGDIGAQVRGSLRFVLVSSADESAPADRETAAALETIATAIMAWREEN
jgi:uncharacterized protein (TIGR02444 family)